MSYILEALKKAQAERQLGNAPTIHAPTYYRPKFSDEEIDLIRDVTAIAAARFGYDGKSEQAANVAKTKHA